jgi:hypothetical protein
LKIIYAVKIVMMDITLNNKFVKNVLLNVWLVPDNQVTVQVVIKQVFSLCYRLDKIVIYSHVKMPAQMDILLTPKTFANYVSLNYFYMLILIFNFVI